METNFKRTAGDNKYGMRECLCGSSGDVVEAGVPYFLFKDELSHKEYGISALCQRCQDKVFVDPDQPTEAKSVGGDKIDAAYEMLMQASKNDPDARLLVQLTMGMRPLYELILAYAKAGNSKSTGISIAVNAMATFACSLLMNLPDVLRVLIAQAVAHEFEAALMSKATEDPKKYEKAGDVILGRVGEDKGNER